MTHAISIRQSKFILCLTVTLLISSQFALGVTRNSFQEGDTTQWRQLFNGKDLTGWKHAGQGFMTVEEGLIRGHGGMGLLYWAGEKFGNCKIRVVYKMEKTNSNSGVFVRIPIEPFEEWMPVFYGHEIQIDNDPEASGETEYHYTGMIYSLTKPLAKTGKPGPQWNTFEITLDGPRTIVYLNGEKVTDYTDGDPVPSRTWDFEPFRGPRPDYGYIGVQNHGEEDVVYFKEVAVKPLR
ncbi:MAG: DUF1080 domain-containing protein [Bacteroidales bacterium]|nr:DUF1080 domain-containing protein [Bacteroidales bacterium]